MSTYLHEEQRYFQFLLGPWTWTGKALSGPFPEWKQVVPKPETLTRKADLTPEAAAELTAFLKTVPDQPPHNPVILSCSKDGASLNVDACGTICTRISAAFSGKWNEFRVSLNKTLLQGFCRRARSISLSVTEWLPLRPPAASAIPLPCPSLSRIPKPFNPNRRNQK